MASAGGDPSWQAMVSVRTSIVPPGPCPPLPDTPGTSPAVTAPQVTASIHDFAGSLGRERASAATYHCRQLVEALTAPVAGLPAIGRASLTAAAGLPRTLLLRRWSPATVRPPRRFAGPGDRR